MSSSENYKANAVLGLAQLYTEQFRQFPSQICSMLCFFVRTEYRQTEKPKKQRTFF